MEKLVYITIKEHTEYVMPKVKGSKFIGNIFSIQDKQQAEQYIKEIQNKYHDATHHCFAYRYGIKQETDLFGQTTLTAKYTKQNDDREPANTAGKPILAQIEGHHLHNVLIVITRYFGGTLLGVGGLIQAYGECAKQTITQSSLIQKEITTMIECSYTFTATAAIRNILTKYHAKLINEVYDTTIHSTIEINEGYRQACEAELRPTIQGKISIVS